MSGIKIPALPQSYPLTLESRFTDLQQSFMGRILFNAVLRFVEYIRSTSTESAWEIRCLRRVIPITASVSSIRHMT